MAFETKTKNKKVMRVNNLRDFEFWLGMYKPRTKKWKENRLKELKKEKSVFETEEERQDKIRALEFLLGK